MNPVNPFISVVIFLLAIASVYVSKWLLPLKISEVKYKSIDGLRGYLAVAVFIHHGAIWYYYVTENRWDNPPSYLFIHFGQTSVLLFFMVTGFLFYSKLIDSYKKETDWSRYYISRFLRLTPLYYLLLFFVILTIFTIYGFKLKEQPLVILRHILDWMTFGITGLPDINGVVDSKLIIAWVTWSIVFEWLFYFTLPFIAFIFFRIKCGWKTILFSLAGSAFLFYNIADGYINVISFAGGIIAAFIFRYEKLRDLISTKIASVIALLCLTCTVLFYETSYDVVPMILISLFFIIVANGNSLFGLLHLDVSRALGQISYTIYLFHGLFLFITFNFISKSKHSPIEHWTIIGCLTLFLIITCRVIYTFYEAPFFKSTSKVIGFFRKN